MIIEQELSYNSETEVADLNEKYQLKPSGYLRMINKVVERHLNKIKFNVEMTMAYNLAWVLVSLSFEIKKPVAGLQTLNAHTWHSERKGPFFRREFKFSDEHGELVFQGSTFSVLLDVEKRTIFRNRQLPFDLMDAVGNFTIEARPAFKRSMDFVFTEERKVYNSHIDCLGHVNNIRYGEYAYDAFAEKEKESLKNLRRMELYFAKELRCGDRFSVLKAVDEDCIAVRCVNEETSDICLNSVFYH